jgi:hypothetical protein
MTTARNITLWFAALILADSIFSLFYGVRYGPASFRFVFRIAMLFAFPVACLYLPFVLSLSKAGRLWDLVLGGSLIGPGSLVIWGLVLSVAGKPPSWEGDGIGLGLGLGLICALFIGCLGSTLYVIIFKLVGRLTTSRSVPIGHQ